MGAAQAERTSYLGGLGKLMIQPIKIANPIMVSQKRAAMSPIRQPIGIMTALRALAAAVPAPSLSVGGIVAALQLSYARSEQVDLFLEPFDPQFDCSRIMAMSSALAHHTRGDELLLAQL